jgi:predicted nucleic acid-binding Zn ribbon protein
VEVCGEPCRRQLCKSSFALKGGGWSGDGYAKKGN